MKGEFLIDGYNLLRALGVPIDRRGARRLERARERMLRWLADRTPTLSALTVVFDAAADSLLPARPTRTVQLGLQVVFAGGYATADDLIIEFCRRHPNPQRLTVVSNDREVQKRARRWRARVASCEEFERLVGPAEPAAPPAALQEKPAESSNAEVRRWLEAFGSHESAGDADEERIAQERTTGRTLHAPAPRRRRGPVSSANDEVRKTDSSSSDRHDAASPHLDDHFLDQFYRDMIRHAGTHDESNDD